MGGREKVRAGRELVLPVKRAVKIEMIEPLRIARILVVFGTRPEAIKMAPVIQELRKACPAVTKVCVTAQHREMLGQVLSLFQIKPDFDLDLMRPDQQLPEMMGAALCGIGDLYRRWRPDLVLVQGDTTTTLAASLAAFYEHIPVGHVEAGLRTRNKQAPWPEEINRRLTGSLATFHFAPTQGARRNLVAEGINPRSVVVTGNTVIDALRGVTGRLQTDLQLRDSLDRQFAYLNPKRRLVLVTGHRRENFGRPLLEICRALRHLAERDDIEIVYPVHLNPNVHQPVRQFLKGLKNVHLIDPLEYLPFAYLMQKCFLILTDSGGIQEEAPFLCKPVLVMRDTTERPEAVRAGTAKLVGAREQDIWRETTRLLDDKHCHQRMAKAKSPFGEGFAAEKIVRYLNLFTTERNIERTRAATA